MPSRQPLNHVSVATWEPSKRSETRSHMVARVLDVGDGQTSGDLENILNVAYDVSTYFLDCLEDHVAQRAFVQAPFRANYP